jgi:glutamate--cysteine ligase catalytic subunit
MEVQLTDFENAAFTVFVVLVSRVILYFNLNFYMPLSAVDANMRRAHVRDAINTQKFCFRQSPGPVVPGEPEPAPPKHPHDSAPPLISDEVRHAASFCCGGTEGVEEFTLYEIMAGKGSFKGLAPLILTYLDLIKTDTATMKTIGNYLDFIVARASGELMTPAQWMRKFVREHPDYKGDSIVPQTVGADLMAKCHRIGLGLDHVPELHGDFHMAPIQTKDAYAVDMGESRRRHSLSLDNTQELMTMHQLRIQMQARRRKLAVEEAQHIATLDEIRAQMRNIDAQLGVLSVT